MSRFETSLPGAYFDDLYAADPDPWRFAASDYEREKYAATLAALPRARYRSALEVGCSIGVLTRELASRCDALLAIDVANAALAQAADRCADLDNVRFDLLQVPSAWPDISCDLILLSEVVYYLDRRDVERLADRITNALADSGDVVLVHWLGETHYPLSGDEAAEHLIASMPNLSIVRQTRSDQYRLDVLQT